MSTSATRSPDWDGSRKLKAHLRRALSIADNFPLAHSNLGNVLLTLGRTDEALTHLRRAVALQPDLADAQNNLGIALAAQGQVDEAGACFEQTLRLKPDHIDAYNNLARVFWAKGMANEALGVLRRALTVRETRETRKLFVQCARSLGFAPDTDDFRNLVVRALTEPWCQTSDIAGIATSLIGRDAAIRPHVERAVSAWPKRLPEQELFGPAGLAELSQNRLLRSLLECAPVSHIDLERFLTATRFALLDRALGDNVEWTRTSSASVARWRGNVSSTSTFSRRPMPRWNGRDDCATCSRAQSPPPSLPRRRSACGGG